MQKSYKQLTRPLVILYIISTALLVVFRAKFLGKGIEPDVILIANLLLFVVTMANLYFQFKGLNSANPNAVIRGVMAATFIKLFILAAAVIIYLVAAGKSRNVNAVFVSMGLYIIYTWMEVRISLRMNPKK
jgi:hypothetical protein